MSNTINPWTGPRLLVPITVEGLVVTNASNGTEFSVQPLQLGEYHRFGNISPNLFVQTNNPVCGIHLNWALPDAMTHGLRDDASGQVLYPYVPNRWLVVRYSADPLVTGKAWIIESDWLGNTSNAQNGIQSRIMTSDSDGNASIQFIGKQYDLDTWTETGQNSPLFLTTLGNSDPLFAAYSGNNNLVFSFADLLSDLPAPVTNPAGPTLPQMSYMVCGWYANPQYDILYTQPPPPKNGCGSKNGWTTEQDWLDLMTHLQWSVGNEAIQNNADLDHAMQAAQRWLNGKGIVPPAGADGKLCGQTLCHGVLLDVVWPGSNVEPGSSVPVYNTQSSSVPYVSSANTSTDCLAAFMQWQLNYNNPAPHPADSSVEIMLEAFSQNMLPQPGGVINTPELMNAIHDSWFGRMPGGTQWVVQRPPKSGNLTPSDSSQGAPLLPPDLAADLAALNLLQTKCDSDYRVLLTLQKQLYADWMKWNMFQHLIIKPPVTADQLTDAMNASMQSVNAQAALLSSDQSAIDNALASLQARLSTAGYLPLVQMPAQNFHTPSDPVLMVNNTGRSFKRGEDLIYSTDDDFLFVRFTGQFISSIQVTTANGNVIVQGSDIMPPFTSNPGLPNEITDLLAEACLLDTAFAPLIAAKAGTGSSVNIIQQQQTLIWNKHTDMNGNYDAALDNRTLEQISGFNPGDALFHVPSKIAVWQWKQPWNPLYLEWEIAFYPCADPALSLWKFNGADYAWAGGNYPPAGETGIIYKGRSILTAKQATTMQAHLQDFVNKYQGNIPSAYIPLKDVITGMGNWDVLSQTLTGFSLQLIQWDIEQFGYQPVDPTYHNGIGNEGHGMPVPDSQSQFFPVRAGFVSINQLWVVDDFGQVYNLNPATGSGPSGPIPPNPMTPIPGIGMEPGNYTIQEVLPEYFQLPPRVVQGSRLDFNFVSADDDSVLSTQVPGTSPVCGWIVPNHSDNSVMVYDNNGMLLGELMPMGPTGNAHAQWIPAPLGGPSASGISNDHLRGFVQGVLGTTSSDEGTTPWSGQALTNLMRSVDETLWSIDPMGERDNQSLSILAGRPIAVLRASVQLELFGNPSNNLSWTSTRQTDNGQIAQYAFPVQIGNIQLSQDGVMGYFTGDNYSTFNSVHQGEVITPASPPYVVNNFTDLQFQSGAPTYITLLLDPRGAVHCSTGFLPVLKVTLPELYVGNALNNMLIEFRSGPLLMDPNTWQTPLPAGAGTRWSWLEPVQQNGLAWTEITNLVSANPIAQMPLTAPSIKEGRLKLAGALGSQLLIFFFQVNDMETPYTGKAGDTVQLSWSSQGAVSATLKIGTQSPVKVDASSPAYAYTISQTQTLTLQVTDQSGATQNASITITAT